MPIEHSPKRDAHADNPEFKIAAIDVVEAGPSLKMSVDNSIEMQGSLARNQCMRRHFLSKLQRIEKALEEASEADTAFLKGCANRLTSLAVEYEKWHQTTLMESSAIESFEEGEEEYARFEQRHFKLALRIDRYLGATAQVTQSRVKLPELRLPTFDGSIEAWLSFRDAFISLIDENTNLSDVDKLRYLKGALTKDASKLIADIEVTSANYLVAWELLKARYENKKLVVKRHIDTLLAVPAMKKDSYESLIHILDSFERNVNMTKQLGVATDGWSVLLAHMLHSRLDSTTQMHWEAHHRSTNVPEYSELITFLKGHALVLQAMATPGQKKDNFTSSWKQRSKSEVHLVNSSGDVCSFCSKGSHSPFKCDTFTKWSIQERYDKVKERKLCINCLLAGHLMKNCSSGSCRVCNQKHHTMLHKPTQTSSNAEAVSSVPEASQSELSVDPAVINYCGNAVLTNVVETPSTILLPTALVKIQAPDGSMHWARALLDGGSQINLVTERLCQRLRIIKKRENHPIGGVGQSKQVSSHSTQLTVQSHCTDFKANWKFHIMRSITWELPAEKVNKQRYSFPNTCTLADPKFYEPSSIDLLIGRESYDELLLEGIVKLVPEKIMLQNTALGWIVSGRAELERRPTTSMVNLVCTTQDLEQQLSKFWEIESCYTNNTLSIEETSCEKLFSETTKRDAEGRFIVTLPTKKDIVPQLGNSFEIAKRRLFSLNRRLASNQQLKAAYEAFLDEYVQLGHMQEITEPFRVERPIYYVPHHCILRPDSLTTKLRVVFDASCATDSGVSLNDALMVGPIVQDDLVQIMLRFRMPKYAIVSDLEKMYRQVWVRKEDRSLQRILWLNHSTDKLQCYELKTITYGTASAPYLATKCLQMLSEQGKATYPEASKVLARDFYMDDLITGVETEGEGEVLCSQLTDLLSSAGFTLRKWASNSSQIMQSIPKNQHESSGLCSLDINSAIKTLGLKWAPSTDQLGFCVPVWTEQRPSLITKRIALSEASRLYDPLGFIGPTILIAKCFMQNLWAQQRAWDEPLELELQRYWNSFRQELAIVKDMLIPRRAVGSAHRIEIHGFSDASLKAYGACLYMRSISEDGSISVNLLCSKSKVAPLSNSKRQKNITLPRLELSGALLLCHLWQKVKHSLTHAYPCFYWVDSTIVLHWIGSNPSRWKQFVANRVSEIQHLTDLRNWHHVPGHQNPADIISRGMMPSQLKESTLWWNGPEWLNQPSSTWPLQHSVPDFVELEVSEHQSTTKLEERKIALVVQGQSHHPFFQLKSTFLGLVRLVAYLQRFLYNCKPESRTHRRQGFLQASELQAATETLVRFAQREMFAEEIRSLETNGEVRSTSALKSLTPQIVNGILRIGGRLRNASIPYDRKHPMILPYKHPLTRLVMESYHRNHLHAGPQLLIATVREKYWPLRVRNLARQIVHECIRCFRCKPSALEQIMGDLPSDRVTPTLPFVNTGVDFCGPLSYRPTSRKANPVKCYVAVFVCLTTKAIHLELVADLSTDAFISTLKRFVARRGRPSILQCDNAKNFRGAERKLRVFHQQLQQQQFEQAIASYCGTEGMEFKFIPPRSPHFGGIWEAAVKSFKHHFRATIGNSVLLRDDLETIIIQIESCLNSRPLTSVSSDPEDLEILTPGHFLIHRPLTAVPEPSYAEVPSNRLDRYQQNQEYVRRIWKRWSTDYLSGLQPRTKWTKQRDNLHIGTLVLLKEENLPPLKWCYGRITHIYRGDDGNVRVVTVKTKDGEYKRAITKICVLPVTC